MMNILLMQISHQTLENKLFFDSFRIQKEERYIIYHTLLIFTIASFFSPFVCVL